MSNPVANDCPLPSSAALARRYSSQFEGPVTVPCMGFHR